MNQEIFQMRWMGPDSLFWKRDQIFACPKCGCDQFLIISREKRTCWGSCSKCGYRTFRFDQPAWQPVLLSNHKLIDLELKKKP